MPSNNIQLDDNGKLRHFLSIEGLNQEILNEILNTAESFTSVTDRTIKKSPNFTRQNRCQPVLRGEYPYSLDIRAGRTAFVSRHSEPER